MTRIRNALSDCLDLRLSNKQIKFDARHCATNSSLPTKALYPHFVFWLCSIFPLHVSILEIDITYFILSKWYNFIISFNVTLKLIVKLQYQSPLPCSRRIERRTQEKMENWLFPFHIGEEENETDICMWCADCIIGFVDYSLCFALIATLSLLRLWQFCHFRTSHDRIENDDSDGPDADKDLWDCHFTIAVLSQRKMQFQTAKFHIINFQVLAYVESKIFVVKFWWKRQQQ